MRSILVGSTAAALLTGAALAQEGPPAGSFGSLVEVSEVQMEVQATDREGRVVEDLRAEELRLSQDDVAVEITGLRLVRPQEPAGEAAAAPGSPATAGASAPASAAGPAGRDGLHLVAFIDNTNVAPFHRRKALGQLWSFLDGSLAPSDRVMVVAYDRGLRVIQPFTSDSKVVLEALRAYEKSSVMALAPHVAEQRVMQQIHDKQQIDVQGLRSDPCTIIENLARNHAAERYNDVRLAAKALEAFVTSLTGLPGRKAVIHVSDGIPMIAGLAPLAQVQELCDGSGLARGVPYSVDLSSDPHDHVDPQRIQMAMAQFDSSALWRDVAAYANLQGVTFYTVHAAGPEPVTGAGADVAVRFSSLETQAAEQRNRLDPLMVLAEDTGGRAILNQSDLAAGFADMMGDLRGYHALTFLPPAAKPGTLHKLRLLTTRPGVTLRYRKSYRFRTRHEQVADRLVGAILHDVASNPMGLAVEIHPGEEAQTEVKAVKGVWVQGRSTRLKLSLPLAHLTLVSGEQEAHGMFTVFVAVLRADGLVTAVRQSTLPVKVPVGALEEARKRSYVYEVELALPEGEHLVGLGVLDELEGGSSFLRQKIKV